MLSSIQQIVVATDYSTHANVAVESAATLATELNASITLTHAVQLPWFHTPRDVNVPPQVWARLRTAADSQAEGIRDHLRNVGIETVELALSDAHRPADLIRRTVAESDADLVVMATHGRRGITRALLGSVTERTLRASQVPVLTVRHRPLELPLREILVPIDFAERSTEAYLTAARLGSQFNARVHLLHVYSPIAESLRYVSLEATDFENRIRSDVQRRLESAREEVLGQGVTCDCDVRNGDVGETIIDYSREIGAGMIVMGVSNRGGAFSRILGSVVRYALQNADCPLLTVRSVDSNTLENDS